MPLGKKVGIDPSDIMLDGDPAPLPKKVQNPHFFPCLLLPNGQMDQDATWYGVGLSQDHIVVDGDPAPPSRKRDTAPNFGTLFVVAKGLDGRRCHLVRR